jgi:hypothetical protein
MDQDCKKRIEEIIGEIKCPKDFRCAQSGFENLCKARDFGLDDYLECLEDNPIYCQFSLSFGDGYFCQCPLRVYLSKKLKK